ncbi:alpha/beta hydrolase family protein [Kiloniella majae]|uniref:alpha/beta hydrolase family protein n=1 Tax=Kiloniella majae TaxID=1938558 RepID=UPI000A2780BA|nr:hypothetical protein [Kiloniella majae]
MRQISLVIFTYVSVFSILLSFSVKADEIVVGVRSLSVESPERSAPLNVMIWYPAGVGGQTTTVGQNAVFEGTVAQKNVSVATGKFPTVLLSHGGMRSASNQSAWLASQLVTRGFMVVDVKAPPLGYDDAILANVELWKRPADISATLTALENKPEWATHIDRQRIGAVGFFLGGTSVLSLVGGSIEKEKFVRSCDEIDKGMDCAWFEKFDVDLRKIDLTGLDQKHRDTRIKGAVVIDPELTESLSDQSLSNVSVPIRVINLGTTETISKALDASNLARKIPTSSYSQIENASQYSAFSICKPKGAFILKEEGAGDEICVSDTKIAREKIHNQMVNLIVEALNQYLKKSP